MQGPRNATNVAAGTATTTIKSAACKLYGIWINTKGASSNTLKVYDNTTNSGRLLGTIDTTASTGPFLNVPDGIDCYTGITCASASGTGADYTVVFE